MLSLKQQQAVVSCVSEMTKAENKEEILNYFLMCFCSDVENCNITLRAIPQIAERMNNINAQRLSEYSIALETALNCASRDRYKPKKDNRQRFSMLAIMLKAQYSNGKSNGMSESEKSLFEEMISYIKDKSGFDIKNEDDWYWAFNMSHTGNFLVNVIKNNIDEKFERPYGK
jgi:hypothetical protein